METYRETESKSGRKEDGRFLDRKRSATGLSYEPTLFNIYAMDLEEEMRKEQTGGITIGKEKFLTITYADDMVLLSKSKCSDIYHLSFII